MAPRKPKRAYHHGDLARTLVQAAMKMIETDGPDGLNLREAARKAGVSVAAPYRHFADREALLAAVLTEGFLELTRVTEEARVAAPSAEASIVAAGTAYLAFASEHPALYRLMFGHGGAKTEYPELLAAGRASLAVLEKAVDAARAEGAFKNTPAPSLTLAGWALVHGLASLSADGLLTDQARRSAPSLMKLLLNGAS